MKIQLEQLDLLDAWPQFALQDGYRAIRLLVRVGAIPIGQVHFRPVRKRVVTHRRLRRQIARLHANQLLKHLAHTAVIAGPEALGWFMPLAWPDVDLSRADQQTIRRYVEQNILLPTGLPSPLRDWVLRSMAAAFPAPRITVALCTRDREATLERTLQQLQQLDYPNFEILVIDNSADFVPTRAIVDRHAHGPVPIGYARCLVPGTSRARNMALAVARSPWVAFIDDDCRPERNWLKELARPAADANCRCVTGLVFPAHLDNAAEVVCDWRDTAMVDPFAPRVVSYDPAIEHPWPATAGAGLLVHRAFARSIGGFDIHLGPGARTVGGGEDAEFLDRVLRNGGNVHHAPAAVAQHDRAMTPKTLRRHIYNRAAGRAAILASRAFGHRDWSALQRLLVGIPRELSQRIGSALGSRSPYPFSLSLLELRATIAGPIRYGWTRLTSPAPRRHVDPASVVYSALTAGSDDPNAPVNPRTPIKPRLAA